MVHFLIGKANSVTNIIIYSRLNALVTVHQLSEEIPLTWLDTPFELPSPRRDPNLPAHGPNLGFVIIPSNINLNDGDDLTSENTSITTYRLQSGLGIVGDTYGTQHCKVESFIMGPFVNNTESIGPRMAATDSGVESDEDESTPFHSNWRQDFTLVANEVLSNPDPILSDNRETRLQFRDEIIARISQSEDRFDTMYPRLTSNSANRQG